MDLASLVRVKNATRSLGEGSARFLFTIAQRVEHEFQVEQAMGALALGKRRSTLRIHAGILLARPG